MNIKRKITRVLTGLLLILLAVCPTPYSPKEASAASVSRIDMGNDASEPAFVTRQDVKVSSRIWELFFGKGDEGNNSEEKMQTNVCKTVIVGGDVFGARIKQSSVTVEDPCQVSELKHGDVIVEIDGVAVSSCSEVRDLIRGSGGVAVTLKIKRGKRLLEYTLTPTQTDVGYSLNIEIRDGAAGIGTITYIDPETGEFGGLGHGICDADTGDVIEISSGNVTGVILGGIQKGEQGKPGELTGILTDKTIGELYSNTSVGVFGRLNATPSSGRTVELGTRESVKEGKATIISTLKNGKKMEYSIEIFDVNRDSHGTKSFKIKVTDQALLAISGGIVRGMSGSPIIQNGKLVGAVTHVMVANPTEGYGIFIENMLEASQQGVQPKAA